MAQDLLHIQQDFVNIVDNIQPWILSHFVMWLDMKVAEFKVYGYMILDQESRTPSVSPRLGKSRSEDVTSLDSNSSDIQDVRIVPKLPTQSKIHSNISSKKTAEHGSHVRNLNKLFVRKYVHHQQPFATVPDERENNQFSHGHHANLSSSQKSAACSSLSDRSSSMHSKEVIHSTDLSEESLSKLPDTSATVHHDHNRLIGGVSIVSLSEDSFSPINAPEKISANLQNLGQKEKDISLLETRSDGQSLYISNVTSLSTTEHDQQNVCIENLPALYKSQQFSQLTTDSHSQKRNAINRWPSNGNSMTGSGVSVNASVDSVVPTSPAMGDEQKMLQGVVDDDSFSVSHHHHEGHLKSHTSGNEGEGMKVVETTRSSPIIVKLEDDSDEESAMVQDNSVSQCWSDQGQGHADNSAETYDPKSVSPSSNIFASSSYFSDSSSGTPVPVDLVAHSDLQLYSSIISSASSAGILTNTPSKNESTFSPKSSKYSVFRDPVTARFQCELCSVTFRNRSSYLRHKRLHGEKRFCCFVCNRKFHRKEHVQLHMNRHGKANELICPMCNFIGTDSTNMGTHFSNIHNINYMFSYGLELSKLNS